ncbi:MAG: polyphenol oxidase family protein [Actinomycetota bacterium]
MERSHNEVSVLTDDDARGSGVLVAFTDRRGGVSGAPYESLNLAARVGDEASAVEENRRRAAAASGFELETLALARQVHGSFVLEVARAEEGMMGHAGVVGEADVLVARRGGVVLGMLTADCAPVVLAGSAGVAVVHAGWRGLVSGVIESGVSSLGEVERAWVGPCIRACCYEVGREVVDAFEERRLPVAGSDRVDIGRAATVALRRAKVGDILVSDVCTSCDINFFSHRRDGITGRQGGFVARLR